MRHLFQWWTVFLSSALVVCVLALGANSTKTAAADDLPQAGSRLSSNILPSTPDSAGHTLVFVSDQTSVLCVWIEQARTLGIFTVTAGQSS